MYTTETFNDTPTEPSVRQAGAGADPEIWIRGGVESNSFPSHPFPFACSGSCSELWGHRREEVSGA